MTHPIRARLDRNRGRIGQLLGLTHPSEVQSAVGDLETLYHRCAALIRDVDGRASVARQRIELRQAFDNGEPFLDILETLDIATQNRIFQFYETSEYPAVFRQHPDAHLLHGAAQRALDYLGPPRRGRPAETDSLALRQAALGLACIFSLYRCEEPTRHVDPISSVETGPFHEFASFCLELLPKVFRAYRDSGGAKGPDYVIRLAIGEREQAKLRVEAGMARTPIPKMVPVDIIDETLWLGNPRNTNEPTLRELISISARS